MSKSIRHHPGIVENGKLRLYDKSAWDRALSFIEGTVYVTVESGELRSLEYNRYYWGVVVRAISEHTGYDPEEIHIIGKNKFLKKTKTIGKEVYEYVSSTTLCTENEFKEYIKNMERWGSQEFGIQW